MYNVIHFLGGKHGLLYISLQASANGLIERSGAWQKHNWKISEKDTLRRGWWLDFSRRAKGVKIFVLHVDAHQKVASAEEDNQVDKTVRSVHSSQ